MDLSDPEIYAPIRHFLQKDIVPFKTILACRGNRPPIKSDWQRRIWLYRNLNPNSMPELELLLKENLEKNIDEYKQKATAAVKQAVKLRDEIIPGAPLILGGRGQLLRGPTPALGRAL